MLKKLEKFVRRQQFCPTRIGMFINPFYISRKGLYTEIKALSRLVYGCVLDVGCGKKPYAHLFDCEKYVGLEIDSSENRRNKKADLFYDGRHIPAEDNSFDWVISSQVLEHVFNPDEFLAEICRVLKNGGGLLITVPFMWDEHEQPYDYARYSSFGIKYLLEKQDFVIAEQRKTASGIRAVFQLINAYLYKITLTKKSCVNLLIWFLLMSPFNILGEILYWFLPRNTGLYLDNIILARKEKV